MRPVLHGDVSAAARALLAAAAEDRQALGARLLDQAEAADRHRLRTGRLHPQWGNGSLMGAARRYPLAVEPGFDDPDYCACMILILQALRACGSTRKRQSAETSVALIEGITTLPLAKSILNGYSERRKGFLAMLKTRKTLTPIDPVWDRITDEARDIIRDAPLMGGLVHACVLHHQTLDKALSYRIAAKLNSNEMSMMVLREIADQAYADQSALVEAARADLMAVFERDPACHRLVQPILYFKGYQAMQAYRIGHWLWTRGQHDLAYFFQMRISEIFGVDIHPAARIGKGIMIDHAHSIVIGETAVVGDNVSMLHSVTLGGTGKEEQDRHPKIEDGVLIGAGAKVLGNIRVGHCSRIAAGSVVLQDVPPCVTVAGVPAKIVGEAGCEQPSVNMDQNLSGCVCGG